VIDWLGNSLSVGDLIVYSSTSTLTGMNLAEITKISEGKIQIQLWRLRADESIYFREKKLTLHKGTSAFKSVTRYLGKIPNKAVV